MKVKDLIKELKGFDKEAEVFLVRDWEMVEDGLLTDLYLLDSVCSQIEVVDMGLDFEDRQQVILSFEEKRY